MATTNQTWRTTATPVRTTVGAASTNRVYTGKGTGIGLVEAVRVVQGQARSPPWAQPIISPFFAFEKPRRASPGTGVS